MRIGLRQNYRAFFILLSFVLLSVAMCTAEAQTTPQTAKLTIQVKVPSNTPAADSIWIVQGVLFSIFGPRTQMSRISGTTDTWQATISAPAGTILRYQFVRNSDDQKQRETYAPFGSDGYAIEQNLFANQSSFRELLVKDGDSIRETVAQWIDLPLANIATGTVSGNVTDKDGNPQAGIWVSAGPMQTLTDTGGAFLIYGVPAGPCTINARSENGEFSATSFAVTVPSNGVVSQNLALTAAPMSNVTFNLTVPPSTPAGAIPLLYGDTYRLGMVQIAGNPEPTSTRYVEMTPLGSGRWTYTTQLGDGSCFNYLYTLGSRSLNYENDDRGLIVVRAACVNGATTVTVAANAWRSPSQVPVTVTLTPPAGSNDTIYVATDFGLGNSPVKMWPAGSDKTTYTFFVNPGTAIKYHYLRNGDPALGPEIIGADTDPPAFRSLAVGSAGVSSNDTIQAWRHEMLEPARSTVSSAMTGPIVSRTEPFQTGIELDDYWRPAWLPLVKPTLERIKSINAQWVNIAGGGWTFVVADPPKGELIDVDPPPQDLIAHIRAAKAAGLHVSLSGGPYPPFFWGTHSSIWYDQLFQQVQAFSVYYAKIAQQEGVEMLILGWLDFDAETHPEDQSTRAYINAKWKNVVAAIRASGYQGKLASSRLFDYPEFDWYADLDYLGDSTWFPVGISDTDTVNTMYDRVIQILTTNYLPYVNRFRKPVLLEQLAYYSARSSALQTYGYLSPEIAEGKPAIGSVPSDYDEQGCVYQAVLLALAATPWVQGAYSFGYGYFDYDSKGYSIRGKTAEQIVSQTYKQINEAPPSNLPVITSVNTAGGFQHITQNGWVEIHGGNLAPVGASFNGVTWDSAPELAGGLMPTQLAGVSVTVNGKPAFVSYVSSGQVNVLTPVDSTTGPVPVVITRDGTASIPFYVNMKVSAPSLFHNGSSNYVLATHADYSLIGPASLSVPGYPYSPARPGETITFWGTGFGLPSGGIVNGSASQSGALPGFPEVNIGGVDGTVLFAGLVGPGLYQINVTLPPGAVSGDNTVRCSWKGWVGIVEGSIWIQN
jgi:uncharacterized protein (TIGR03437 family)